MQHCVAARFLGFEVIAGILLPTCVLRETSGLHLFHHYNDHPLWFWKHLWQCFGMMIHVFYHWYVCQPYFFSVIIIWGIKVNKVCFESRRVSRTVKHVEWMLFVRQEFNMSTGWESRAVDIFMASTSITWQMWVSDIFQKEQGHWFSDHAI